MNFFQLPIGAGLNDPVVGEVDGAKIRMAPPGRMYEVNINANPDDFLDWDAPLSEQSESARKAIQPLLERYMGPVYDQQIMNYEPKSLGSILEKMDRIPSRQAAQLLENGAPGIKYYDAGSRASAGGELLDVRQGLRPGDGDKWRAKVKVTNRTNTFGDTSDMFKTSPQFATEAEARAWADNAINNGTRNFVVFDENLISIVRKYGIAGAAAYLGMPEDEVRQAVGGS